MEPDDEYEDVYSYLFSHSYPNNYTKQQKRALRRKAENFKVEKGALFYLHKLSTRWKQVPRSENERKRILEACHSFPGGKTHKYQRIYIRDCIHYIGGHLGRDKTYHKLAERFYWKGQWKDVEMYVRTCLLCQTTNDAKFIKESAPLHPIPVKPEVWRQVHVHVQQIHYFMHGTDVE